MRRRQQTPVAERTEADIPEDHGPCVTKSTTDPICSSISRSLCAASDWDFGVEGAGVMQEVVAAAISVSA